MSPSDNISRRDFLEQLSVVSGSLPWIALLAQGEAAAQTRASDRIRVGIVGVGSRGTKLLLHLQTIPEVEITAVCDDYPPHLYEAGRLTDGHARTFSGYGALLEQTDVDAVIIATPPDSHADIACDAMRSGKAVFCEKVMALTIEDCSRMMGVQRGTGRILQIGFQRLFDVRYLKAFEVVREGKLGQLTCLKTHWHRNDSWRRPVRDPRLERRTNWRLYKEASGGLMAELAAHQIVTSNWILGEVPTRVTGFGGVNYWKDGRETDDNISVVFSYPSGVLLTQTVILSNKHYGVVEQIIGSEATIELETGRLFLEASPPSPGIHQLLQSIQNQLFKTIPLGGASWVLTDQDRHRAEYLVDELRIPSPTQLELEAFVESVKSNKPIPDLLEQSYNASVAAILANRAIDASLVIEWPAEVRL
jgi:predicted dehydrogenase